MRLLVLGFAFFGVAGYAQPTWVSVDGPKQADIHALVTDSTGRMLTVLGGHGLSYPDIFRREGQKQPWSWTRNGEVHRVAASPGGTFFVFGSVTCLLGARWPCFNDFERSEDGGLTWEPFTVGSESAVVGVAP